jgi:hypothetical protein
MLFALLWMLIPFDLPLTGEADLASRAGVAVDAPTDSGVVHALEDGFPQPPPK